jgi:hypothetical protein
MILVFQMFAAALKTPVLPHRVIIEWFATGVIRNDAEASRLARWLSGMFRAGHVFQPPQDKTCMLLSLPGLFMISYVCVFYNEY